MTDISFEVGNKCDCRRWEEEDPYQSPSDVRGTFPGTTLRDDQDEFRGDPYSISLPPPFPHWFKINLSTTVFNRVRKTRTVFEFRLRKRPPVKTPKNPLGGEAYPWTTNFRGVVKIKSPVSVDTEVGEEWWKSKDTEIRETGVRGYPGGTWGRLWVRR